LALHRQARTRETTNACIQKVSDLKNQIAHCPPTQLNNLKIQIVELNNLKTQIVECATAHLNNLKTQIVEYSTQQFENSNC